MKKFTSDFWNIKSDKFGEKVGSMPDHEYQQGRVAGIKFYGSNMSDKPKELPKPVSRRQHMYITSECDVTLYGGAAGSGKSEIGVIDFLQFTDIPNFIGIMTRRHTTQLKAPGGILAKCKRIFSKVYAPDECIWKEKDGKFVFPKSGAEIYLKHFENDNADDDWQGTEANLFYVDEGTQFTQHMIQYIMSRMRNPNCPEVEPKLKITCNPDADHFLRKWVEPYLKEDGTPDRGKDGLIRYFTFMDGDFIWGDSKEELVENYGVEYEDVLSFTFISATVNDNPIVKKINPKYVGWLKGLRGVERARLLDGNWHVRESSAGFFKREWVNEIAEIPGVNEFDKICRAYDFAGSLPSDANPNPDYTVCVKMGRRKVDKSYVILEVIKTRIRFGEWLSFILEQAARDGPQVNIILPIDPNPAANAATQMLVREITAKGYYVQTMRAVTAKLDRFRPFSSAAQNGLVSIVTGCASDLFSKSFNDNNIYYYELEKYDGSKKARDDLVDATSDAFMHLASSLTMPTGILKGLTSVDMSNQSPLLNIK